MNKDKAKGILFSTEMVKAVLDGRKTQTRRCQGLEVVNQEPDKWSIEARPYQDMWGFVNNMNRRQICKPRYKIGDLLYVKETYAIECNYGIQDVYTHPSNPLGPVYWLKDEEDCRFFETPRYRASEPDMVLGDSEDGMKWSPSLFMPRTYARIFLSVTNVRVERLQKISDEDAISEGIETDPESELSKLHDGTWDMPVEPVTAFAHLWDSINGKPKQTKRYGELDLSWKANPFVWVYEC